MIDSGVSKKPLYFGLFIFTMGLYFFGPTYFTQPKNLVQVSGLIENVEIDERRVRSGTKPQLEFKLKNNKQEFRLFENVMGNSTLVKYLEIKRKLEKFNEASVLIRKNEISKSFPKVYQISNRREGVIYSIRESKRKSRNGLIMITLFGMLGVIIYFFQVYLK